MLTFKKAMKALKAAGISSISVPDGVAQPAGTPRTTLSSFIIFIMRWEILDQA